MFSDEPQASPSEGRRGQGRNPLAGTSESEGAVGSPPGREDVERSEPDHPRLDTATDEFIEHGAVATRRSEQMRA